ncbi:MAG: flagellar basal body rod protein FlgB [Oscillospiraceae bacterium]|nr:flagellar basal body rod protein FlgB [Oscillospiraceae bacterium]
MWDNIFKPVDLLQKGLSAAWTRNAVIRNNIANVETPGFKASDVEFETLMLEALEGSRFKGTKTHPRHIDIGAGNDLSSVHARVVEREYTSMRMDENNVDIEDENVKLAQNSLYYNTLMEKMNSELRRLRMAINEGR